MKKSLLWAIVLMTSVSSLLPSCMSDSDKETTATSDCAITNMVLGTLRRTVTTKRWDGRDTTYVTNMYAGHYALLVDQLNHEIYNPDSLPQGTDVTKVTFQSIAADGGVAYRTLSGNDTLYSTSDSIDFTEPRLFTCYAYDGEAKQTYRVHVNVHKVNPEAMAWQTLGTVEALKDVTSQKLLVNGTTVYIFARNASGAFVLTSPAADGTTWTRTPLTDLGTMEPRNVVVFGGQFYALGNGQLWQSADGKSWTAVASDTEPQILCGASRENLYGVKDGKLYASADAREWIAEPLDDDGNLLPLYDYAMAYMPMTFNPQFEYLLLGGRDGNGQAALWKRTVDLTGQTDDVWAYYPASEALSHPFPALAEGTLLAYDTKVLTIGCEGDSVSLFSVSEDAGRSWLVDRSKYLHPSGLKATSLGCGVDSDQYIWLSCGGTGTVLKGRLNRLGFKTEQMQFTE